MTHLNSAKPGSKAKLNKEVITLCEWLDSGADMMPPGKDLLTNVKIYEGSNKPCFTQWACGTYNAVLKYMEA
jgi:hypothetical protein